jgi:hypothetical protein
MQRIYIAVIVIIIILVVVYLYQTREIKKKEEPASTPTKSTFKSKYIEPSIVKEKVENFDGTQDWSEVITNNNIDAETKANHADFAKNVAQSAVTQQIIDHDVTDAPIQIGAVDKLRQSWLGAAATIVPSDNANKVVFGESNEELYTKWI